MNYSSHAALDLPGRRQKAEKIHRLLELATKTEGRQRMLEVGTGSGAIAHYFSKLPTPRFEVSAIDVEDQRQVVDGYSFQTYDGNKIPYADDSFDVVISNHVIEHIGGREQQERHLREIRRVLAPGGCLYLATPSRWQVVEPHFSLPFLSWIPRTMADVYVHLSGKGERYDCDPLGPVELRRLFKICDLDYRNLTVQAIRALIALEQKGSLMLRMIARIPAPVLERFSDFSPTLIYLASKPLSPAS